MADNFDSNIARRKPNILRKPKPKHPWDVSSDTPGPAIDEQEPMPDPPEEAIAPEPETPLPSETPVIRSETPSRPFKTEKAASVSSESAKSSPGLSNAINIHSNFCKLDNDVSDKLLPKLSPSAQSVYLRLYRQSYGWNRNWASESLPKLSKCCNQSLQTIRKAIKELETFGCISKEMSDYHRATVYRVYLPSEILHVRSLTADNGLSDSDSLNSGSNVLPSQNLAGRVTGALDSDADSIYDEGVQNLDGRQKKIRGQDSAIQSLYFSGTSIYALLESGGATPINIHKYIFDKHLGEAVATVDEFYSSIGFSIVSRAQYRKSIIDYLDLIDSGFSVDDIKYAVRWTFMNSRTRPESFSLIKHTMHLAMNDLISELKNVSGEKAAVKKKQAALDKRMESGDGENNAVVNAGDRDLWNKVVEDLKKQVNDHSFRAFIEPLTLISSGNGSVTLEAPADSISWIDDHYRGIIEEVYEENYGKQVSIELV